MCTICTHVLWKPAETVHLLELKPQAIEGGPECWELDLSPHYSNKDS